MSRYMYINIMVDMVEREEGGIQTYIQNSWAVVLQYLYIFKYMLYRLYIQSSHPENFHHNFHHKL